MKILNLKGFKHVESSYFHKVVKMFVNADHIVSVAVYEPEHPYTVIQITEGTIELEGNVSEPIMYQLVGREL
jgi:hypothetical protein